MCACITIPCAKVPNYIEVGVHRHEMSRQHVKSRVSHSACVLMDCDLLGLILQFVVVEMTRWHMSQVCMAWRVYVTKWPGQLQDIDDIMSKNRAKLSYSSLYNRIYLIYLHKPHPPESAVFCNDYHRCVCEHIWFRVRMLVLEYVQTNTAHVEFLELCNRTRQEALLLNEIFLYMIRTYCSAKKRLFPGTVCLRAFEWACNEYGLSEVYASKRALMYTPYKSSVLIRVA